MAVSQEESPPFRAGEDVKRRLIIMALHYAIVIALVLHLVSCIFLGESRMPETLH